MKDNPYIVVLDPQEFHLLYEIMTTHHEYYDKDDPEQERELALLKRISEVLNRADQSHKCKDEQEATGLTL